MLIMHDPLVKDQMSPAEQNEMKWAGLLHDIDKLSLPVLHGKDHTHPFKSAAICIDVFQRLGMANAEDEKLNRIKQLITESMQSTDEEDLAEIAALEARGKGPYCKEIHDHSKLGEIFDLAWAQGAMPRLRCRNVTLGPGRPRSYTT